MDMHREEGVHGCMQHRLHSPLIDGHGVAHSIPRVHDDAGGAA
jgi:hypothetical protein